MASKAWAQTTPPPDLPDPPVAAAAGGDQSTTSLPVDLSRIRLALERPEAARKFDDGRLRFYAEVVERPPTFKELTLGFNLRHGPVPGAGMTHQEFLSMVTPRNLYGSGGIRALETLEWGLVSYAAMWTIKRLYKELSEARTEWRAKQIRDQIDRELAALRGGK